MCCPWGLLETRLPPPPLRPRTCTAFHRLNCFGPSASPLPASLILLRDGGAIIHLPWGTRSREMALRVSLAASPLPDPGCCRIDNPAILEIGIIQVGLLDGSFFHQDRHFLKETKEMVALVDRAAVGRTPKELRLTSIYKTTDESGQSVVCAARRASHLASASTSLLELMVDNAPPSAHGKQCLSFTSRVASLLQLPAAGAPPLPTKQQ